MDPLPLSVRDPARFSLETLHNKACGAVERILHRGIAGKIPREKAASVALGLKAAGMILDRTAPAPKAVVEANVLGDLVISWRSDSSPSPTPLAPFKPNSMPPSPLNALEPPSSSATDDLANL